MSLAAGSRLGTCEIVSLLGSGGMGEVYRARDTRLGRDVALKVLPDAFTLDADRLARFQREAQLLASLNHANIAAIYGIEESAGTRGLILELVDGPTLADRIALGPVPIDEALSIARQIADALESAHEQGIVHRDLKPANIKVRPDGTVKVLDFGLAKIVETATPSASGLTGLSQSPTLTSPALTRLGLILGTAAYMAPEQAKGQPADRRSDVWAFGCVLFEMLTGKRAFGGEDVADTLAAVLRADPDWSALPDDAVSVSVRPLLERCLRKDARKRLPHIGAARLDLDDALARLGKPDQPVVSTHDETRWRGRIGWIAAAAAIAIAGVLAVPAITHWSEAAPIVHPEMRLEIATPSTAFPNSFALSPDGRYIVHSAFTDGTSQLWLRAMDTGISRVLQGTEGGRNPFWSADGRSIGFFARSMVNRIDLAGGVPRALAPAVPGLGGAWNADGVILFGSGAPRALQRVSASGGAPTSATKLADGDSVHVHPSFLPDQRQFVVLVNGRRPGLYLGSLDSPDLKWLTESESGALFMAPGWLLFVRDGALVARRFDRVKQVVIGEPVVVANQINATRATLADLPFSVSTTGLLAFRGRDSSRRQLVWVDRAGKRLGEATAALDGDIMNPEISPDGRRIAAELSRESNQDIWVFDGPRRVRISSDAARDAFPVWSPDGSRILFGSQRTGQNVIFEKPSNGSGTETRLEGSPDGTVPYHVSRDGRFVAYLAIDPKTRENIGVLPLVGERTPRSVVDTGATELWAQFSPDGKWIAYQSSESGSWEVYLRPFPGPGGQWPISTAGGIHVRWAPDGKEVYYVGLDGRLMAVPVALTGSTPVLGTPVPLFDPGFIYGGASILGQRQQYDVAKDGRFLLNVAADGGAMSPITVVLNWAPLNEH